MGDMAYLGGGAAFWFGYLILFRGYGVGTLLVACRGGKGRETDGDWELQDLARTYFLAGYAFPKRLSMVFIVLSFGALIGAIGTWVTWNPHSHFMVLEFACVGTIALLSLFGFRKNRAQLLESLASGWDEHSLWQRLQSMELDRPTPILDIATLSPSWVAMGFLATAIVGAAMLYFPALWQEMQTARNWQIWILGFANLFSLPIFLGFSILGLFPWPVGGTQEKYYYPLLVLRRDMQKKCTARKSGTSARSGHR